MTPDGFNRRATTVLLSVLFAVAGLYVVSRLYADFPKVIYPPDKNILVSRSFEPSDFSAVGTGEAITVTVTITNNEDVALRGFYFSDQVPSAWSVESRSVSVNGAPISDHSYQQGTPDEVYTGFTPHRWALETPQGSGVFSPTHPIPASGGIAQIAYTMIVNEGTADDFVFGQEAWAGWLATVPAGTAIFGYDDVPLPLTAEFSANPRSGPAPLTVQFADLSTGDATGWEWDFGDGNGSTIASPEHIYANSGTYTVELGISGIGESDTESKPSYITVYEPVVAEFWGTPTEGPVPLTVQFSNQSQGDYDTRLWDFGDGATSTQEHPAHTYTTTGAYTVTLRVDGPGGTDTRYRTNFITAEGIGATITPETGGTLVFTDTNGSPTVIQVPADAVTETITLTYSPVDTATAPSGLSSVGHAFDLEAGRSGVSLPGFTFEKPISITIHYAEADLVGLDEHTLELRYWNGSEWSADGITAIERNIAQNYAVFTVEHLSTFALLGEELWSFEIHLPLALRNNR